MDLCTLHSKILMCCWDQPKLEKKKTKRIDLSRADGETWEGKKESFATKRSSAWGTAELSQKEAACDKVISFLIHSFCT